MLKRATAVVLFALCAFVFSFPALLPLPKKLPKEGHRYLCVWEDGSISEESFASAFECLVGTDGEKIFLVKEGIQGTTPFLSQTVYQTLKTGDFGELTALKWSGAENRLDRVAVFRTFSDTLWLSYDYFEWTGTQFARTEARLCETLVCLDGVLSSKALVTTQASELELRKETVVSSATLKGSRVNKIVAEPPYFVEGGALYYDAVSGRRFLTALPGVTQITVVADYCDMGALLAAEQIERVTLPFVGNMPSSASSYFHGEFAYLFEDGDYRVPPSLKYVRVTGGTLVSFAFYGCSMIEEVDACGVAENAISPTAFVSLISIKKLHTPRADIFLPEGKFASYTAECGCTVYERV